MTSSQSGLQSAAGLDGPRGGRIADPVHGYVDFSWIERLILDHPVSQRLRYVRTNGLCHLVFPEVNSSRFAHSLGAMHLSSRFFAALIRNSDADVREKFVSAIAELVKQEAGAVSAYVSALDSLPSTATRCIRAHLEAPGLANEMKVAEQAFRLAALFHDLGHLPFSHDFEEGLQSYWDELTPAQRAKSLFAPLFREAGNTGEKLHERLGHGLALVIFNDVFSSDAIGKLHDFVRVAFDVANRILTDAPRRPATNVESALSLLHGLIDGELDVDRCDYILRDGRNYGFEFALFDLDRLVDNLRLVNIDAKYHVAVRAHGLTALETFLLARYRSYENGVRHHKVAQVGAALRYSIGEAIRRFQRSAGMTQFMKDVGFVGGLTQDTLSDAERQRLLTRFATYDDGWFMQWLRRLDRETDDPWVGVACRRAPARSFWKRPDQFKQLVTSVEAWNEGLPSWEDDTQVAAWTRELRRLRREGVLVLRHRFKPWTPDPVRNENSSLLVETALQDYEPVNRASTMVESLRLAWNDAVQVQAFASEACSIDGAEVLRRLPRFEKGATK